MIELQNVSKMYPGRNCQPVAALEGVEFKVEQGDFVMIVGPSGSGKSTLLFTVGAMLSPTSGKVMLDGRDLYGLSPKERAAVRRSELGFLFQTFNLIPYLSCLENVALPCVLTGTSKKASLERARDMLGRMGLAHRLPHRPAELSVGERQRVALCRSIVNDPPLLLADEPTGNLDRENTEGIMNLLLELNGSGQTILMVTHDLELAERGTKLLALRDGRLCKNPSQGTGACDEDRSVVGLA